MFIINPLGYGFAMGQLFYVRELAPNGPAINCGEIQPGDRVIEVNDELFKFAFSFNHNLVIGDPVLESKDS